MMEPRADFSSSSASNTAVFADRKKAGLVLGQKVADLRLEHPFVLALPRGGVAVGSEVAKVLQAPLGVAVVRKISVPWQPELAVGAVTEEGGLYLDESMMGALALGKKDLKEVIKKGKEEVARQVKLFRWGHRLPDLAGRTVVLTDDGLATGATAIAAARTVKKHHPASVIFAAPVCAVESLPRLEPEVERIIYLLAPGELWAVGAYYDDFSPVSDEEVRRLLV